MIRSLLCPVSTSRQPTQPAQDLAKKTSTAFRQAYISRATENLSEIELTQFAELLNWRYQKLGLKNLVLHFEGRLIHILEGPELVVRRAMEDITRDERIHSLITNFSIQREAAATLKDASLIISNIDEAPQDMVQQLRKLATTFQWTRGNREIGTTEIGFLKGFALFTFARLTELDQRMAS